MEFLSPQKRLNSLFYFHTVASCLTGAIGFAFPTLWGALFTDGSVSDGVHNSDGGNVAHLMIRLYGALLFTQGWLVYNCKNIDDGHAKRAIIKGYFGCFAASLVAVVGAHLANDGTVAGSFFGILKIVLMSVLTLGYGWFAFFETVKVFELPRNI